MLQHKKGRILALDLGQKNTGVSITDLDQGISFLREDFKHENDEGLIKKVLQMISNEGVIQLVLGLPLSLNGQENPQCEWVRKIAKEIEAQTHVPIEFVDERFSTKQGKNHDLAAKIILEQFLDQRQREHPSARLRAAIPGSSLPSKNSSIAPPPVET